VYYCTALYGTKEVGYGQETGEWAHCFGVDIKQVGARGALLLRKAGTLLRCGPVSKVKALPGAKKEDALAAEIETETAGAEGQETAAGAALVARGGVRRRGRRRRREARGDIL